MSERIIRHRYTQQGPFTRAHIVVYGRTPGDALQEALQTRTVFADTLPIEYNCWSPSYAGFDPQAGRHMAEFIVGFGAGSEGAPGHIERLLEALRA